MSIQKDKVVAINYTLTNNAGQVIDSSEGRDPLQYIHGNGHLIAGLEEALEGKQQGDQLEVAIPPEKGYGVRNEEHIQKVPTSQFSPDQKLEVGMQFQVKNQEAVMVFTVSEIEGDLVTLDGNHPLAGVTLNFAVEVMELRDASKEELDHGHVHGPEGHQ